MRQGEERTYKRRRTIFPDESDFLCTDVHSSPAREILPNGPQDNRLLDHSVFAGSKRDQPNTLIKEYKTDPWESFEPIAKISQNRLVFLSRNKVLKHRLVHIEQLDEEACLLTSTITLLEKIHHRSFLSLQESYHHSNSIFFVWEPVEVSISQIMASKCMITASEIIAIVRPIIDGIHHLLQHGRALACLTPDTVFVTRSGNVKIGGVEKSCQIMASEMNPAIWKAYALADIVTRLMAKNRSHEWNADMKTLPDDLRTMTIDSLLQKPVFQNVPHPEELVLLVTLTTKTAYHQVDSYSVRS